MVTLSNESGATETNWCVNAVFVLRRHVQNRKKNEFEFEFNVFVVKTGIIASTQRKLNIFETDEKGTNGKKWKDVWLFYLYKWLFSKQLYVDEPSRVCPNIKQRVDNSKEKITRRITTAIAKALFGITTSKKEATELGWVVDIRKCVCVAANRTTMCSKNVFEKEGEGCTWKYVDNNWAHAL